MSTFCLFASERKKREQFCGTVLRNSSEKENAALPCTNLKQPRSHTQPEIENLRLP